MSQIRVLAVASLTVLALAMLGLLPGAGARDTSMKVRLDGQLWFCSADPSGWTLADFKAICSQIEPGGKGPVIDFVVDRNGKVRRKK